MSLLTVRVPATTANLGSGFDCVGMAFNWYDELTLELLDQPGLEVVVTGEGADGVPLDESHLVVASLLDGLAHFGAERPAGMRLTFLIAAGGMALATLLSVAGPLRARLRAAAGSA